ncbi:hypothetical protein [Paenibacillus ehimensis]|uniref:hypothetical protein n=1 Tax=Paenibacillus ehimensis TaxID=79264 RepID=UPI0004724218|nr:hypothetical protein [Paenibacillus ehimensis]
MINRLSLLEEAYAEECEVAYEDMQELLVMARTMYDGLEQLIEDYHRRQRSATMILDDPNTLMEQRTRVHGKKEVYWDILFELNRILPINEEGDGG